MYHDLNVCIEDRKAALAQFTRFGYNIVAFNRIVNAKRLTDEHKPPEQVGPQATLGVLRVRKEVDRGAEAGTISTGIQVLERITLIIDDTSKLSMLNSPILQLYDIVAVQPSNEKLLLQCLQSEFDVISLPLGSRMPFYIKRPHVNVAKEKGVFFEIPYAMALRDNGQRRSLIGNAAVLLRATVGKQLITSSGATSAMELRGPHDIINLGLLFNLSQEQARLSVCRFSGEVVKHGDARAHSHKGITGNLRGSSLREQEDNRMEIT